MKVKIRKLRLSLALVAILLFTLAQVFNVTATPTNQEKAITFLRDVAGLDMAKYELTNAREFPAIMYTFTSGNNTLDVLCVFSDGELIACHLIPESGPLLAQSFTDPLAAARIVVDRYESFSKASYVQQMRETLNMISDLKTATAAAGNLTLRVIVGDNFEKSDYAGTVQFEWTNTTNDIKNIYNKLVVGFKKGAFFGSPNAWVFSGFSEDLDKYPIGSDVVEVSKDEAVALAAERLKTFSYSVGDVRVEGLVFAKDAPVSAEVSMQPRKTTVPGTSNSTFMLFPHWEIYLPLDKVYLGNVASVRVMMWADTGEIDSFEPSASLGTPSTEDTSTPSPTETSTPSTTDSSTPSTAQGFDAGYALTAVVIATVTIAAAAYGNALKKRRRSAKP